MTAARFFALSFLSLYWEILCIRWIPSEVSYLGFFTNFVLMACFLGLGLGCLLTHLKPRLFQFFPLLSTGLVVMALESHRVRVLAHNSEILFLDYREAWFDVDIWVALSVFYLMISLVFTTMGQEIGRQFKEFPSLTAYSINTLGALSGVLAFSLLSWFSLPAYIWALLGFLPVIWLLGDSVPKLVVHTLVACLGTGLIYSSDKGARWSPYHKITTSPLQINMKTGNPYPFEANQNPADIKFFPETSGFNLLVNGLFYQQPLALNDASVAANPLLGHLRKQYDIPYKIGSNERVLIVGGGSGNDAASALRNGAKEVDVVDIDPLIVQLGREKHPDHPYSDGRVHVTIDDARSYFRKNLGAKQYDKIAFGLVDSHILTSSLSNIRIDSYVYTEEAFRDAARLLSPKGIIVINFTIVSPRFSDKLYQMLSNGLGSPPVVLSELQKQVLGVTLVAGPGMAQLQRQVGARQMTSQVPSSTDDWPFFYLLSKAIGEDYLKALGLILLMSASLVGVTQVSQKGVRIEWQFFWLGAAFMLLESRSVTSLALLFGSTWQVNSVVLSSVLVMIWLSNQLVHRGFKLNRNVYFAGLAMALLMAYLLSPVATAAGSRLGVVVLAFLPIIFAGGIFSTAFAQAEAVDLALGANILGCILGGCLEYLSMITGFHTLWLVIAGLYFLAWWTGLKKSV